MSYDVVVVGGGIGGLTIAALLSARGIKTCLLERQSQVGGCIARTQFSGYDFEPGMGLYPEWESGGIYERVFSQLPVDAPNVTLIESDYLVRLEGDRDIRLKKNDAEFAEELRKAFPECSQDAIEFYQLVDSVNQSKSERVAPLNVLGRTLQKFWSTTRADSQLKQAQTATALSFATNTSTRFQRFIDAQLKAFLQTSIDRCAFGPACVALGLPRRNLYSIENGIATLAERLAESIKLSGGVVRLNSPVLRLSYDHSDHARGVDLLSGETILAKRAIVSNLTIWDTYGKLIGLNRTPPTIKSRLSKIQSSGAYVIYAALDESANVRLPAQNFLVAANETNGENLSSEFTVAIGQENEDRKFPVTVKTGTDVAPWFSFQSSEEDYEQWDQTALELLWDKLHHALPELGSGIEVIETANPRTFYDLTRRKLGMVMGVESLLPTSARETTTLNPNLFMIGDTVTPVFGVSSIMEGALLLAAHLRK